jgi:hypothetical protein
MSVVRKFESLHISPEEVEKVLNSLSNESLESSVIRYLKEWDLYEGWKASKQVTQQMIVVSQERHALFGAAFF